MGSEQKTAPNVLHSKPFFSFLIDFQPACLLPLTLLFIGRQPAGLPEPMLKKDTINIFLF
jgi:hypothetical protein